MAKKKIYMEDVLNLPIKFQTQSEHDMNVIRYVLDEVMKAVRELPEAEDPKRVTRKRT